MPYSKRHSVTSRPSGLTVPFNFAVVPPISVAAPVLTSGRVTIGGSKTLTLTLESPEKEV